MKHCITSREERKNTAHLFHHLTCPGACPSGGGRHTSEGVRPGGRTAPPATKAPRSALSALGLGLGEHPQPLMRLAHVAIGCRQQGPPHPSTLISRTAEYI